MNLVFGAEGLTVGEGAFLMACCNHTDDRGYVIASMRQLADEAHMEERTARNNKQRLIKRGLLAAGERRHPKNRARLADLYRVNLDLLRRMQRERTDYGPTFVEELTFAASEENRRSDPPEKSAPPPEKSAPTPPEKSAPLLPPSSAPSPLPVAPPVAGDASAPEKREMATPRDTPAPGSGPCSLPEGVSDTDRVVDAYVTAYMAAAGMPPRPGDVRSLRAAAAALLSAGRSVGNLCTLAAQLAAKGWVDLAKHALMNPEAAARPAAVLKPWCGECNYGEEPMFPAGRMRESADGGLEKCHCHPGHVPAPAPAGV